MKRFYEFSKNLLLGSTMLLAAGILLIACVLVVGPIYATYFVWSKFHKPKTP
jgi:hypothetical protein